MKPSSPLRVGSLAIVLACVAAGARAADEPARPAASATAGPPGAFDDELESTRRAVQFSAEWLARGFDSWFGKTPFDQGGSVSNGQLSFDLLHRQDEGTKVRVRFNARFRLPNVERNAYVLIGRDNEREVVTDQPGAVTRQQRLVTAARNEQSFFAGLGVLVDAFDLRVGLRGGLKLYAQARYRKSWELGAADRIEFRETLFWTADDRLGSTTALGYNHAWSPTLTMGWLNTATITQRVGKFEWSSVLGAYKLMGPDRLLSLEVLGLGGGESDVGLADYGLRARWQQPVHKDWLIGEVVVGQFWPRPNPTAVRSRAWAVGAGLTLRF